MGKLLQDPVCLTQSEIQWINSLIKEGNIHNFYVWRKWDIERLFVLQHDRFECQMCKARGRYSKAVIVHHVEHLKRRPDLALSMFTIGEDGKQKRQLISVCRACHERCHPERMRRWIPRTSSNIQGFQNDERWD